MMRHWKIKRLANGLGEHAAAWDALNQRLFNGHPLLDSRFVDGLLKHFGNGSEHLCVLELNGVPEAMCLLRPRGFGIWTTFLPSQAQIGPVLIQKQEALRHLMRSLPGFVARLDFLCNDPVFGDLPTGDHATSSSMDHALTMNVSLVDNFESYWAALSKKLVQNIGRYERSLTADNVARKLLCITDPKDVSAAVARHATLESKGWKGTLETAIGVNDSQGIFYDALMVRFAASGNAMVYELWFDDRLVASQLIIASEDMIVMLNTTYDEAFNKYAPGRLLLHDVIQSLFATHPGKVIEFYTDANADQLAWATGQRWIRHVSVYRNSLTARLFGVMLAGHHSLLPDPMSPPPSQGNHSVDVFQHPDQLPPDVQQLFAKAEQENFQLGIPWLRNLVNTVFPDHGGVRFYVLRREGRPMAILPILATKGALGWQVQSFSNYYTSLYAPVIASELKDRDLALLIRAVLDAHAPVAYMRFAPMNPESMAYRRLQGALQANGLRPFGFFCFGNWYLSVTGNWSNYLKDRSGTLRNTIKRMTKKLVADGGAMELILGDAELGHGLDAYERVYATSWKESEPYPKFIPGLVKMCSAQGVLRLGLVKIRDKPIAAQLWIVANGKAYIFKVAYDEKYKAYAPGSLLTAMLMEHVLESDQVTEVDFLTGDDPYKKTWMSHRRERWGIIAYNPKTIRGMLGLSKEISGRTLRPFVARIRTLTLMTKIRKPENRS